MSVSVHVFLNSQGLVKFNENGTRVQEFVFVFQYRINRTASNGITRAVIGKQNFVVNTNFEYQNGENNSTTWDS